MRKLTISNKQVTFNIIIDRMKFIWSSKYSQIHALINIVKQFCGGITLSESQEHSNKEIVIEFNDEKVNPKNLDLFLVTQHYDLNTDLKMNAKSLVYRYFESLINVNEFNDDLVTIKSLLESFAQTIDCLPNIGITVNDFGAKNFIKLLEPYFVLNDLVSHDFDMSYDKKVMVQLDLLEKICLRSNVKNIILIDIPEISDSILSRIMNFSSDCFLLIIINQAMSRVFDYRLYGFLKNNRYIDLADETSIYESIINNLSIHCEFDDVVQSFIDITRDHKTHLTQEILNLF